MEIGRHNMGNRKFMDFFLSIDQGWMCPRCGAIQSPINYHCGCSSELNWKEWEIEQMRKEAIKMEEEENVTHS
jgi:hypothetical protein